MVVLTSFTQPTEGIRHEQSDTSAHLNSTDLGKGTLYVAESQLSWVGSSGNGFSIEYRHISLHAVSKDLVAFPHECLYLLLDTALEGEKEENEDDEGDGDAEDQGITELRFVPEDKGTLDAMFHAMSACQALHPDPQDSFSDEDFFEDADDEVPMEETDSQMASLNIGQNGDSEHHEETEMDPGCYEDADDSPEN